MRVIDIIDKFIQIGKDAGATLVDTRLVFNHAYIEFHEKELVVHLPTSQGLMSDIGFNAFNRILAELYYGGIISANYVIRYCPMINSVFQKDLRLLCITPGVKCVESDGVYHIPLAVRETESQYEQPKNFEDMLCVL